MKVTAIHQSRPPLRWIANAFNRIDTYFLLKALYLEEDGKGDTFAYKFNAKMYNILSRPYMRWGTTYKAEFDFDEDESWDMSSSVWDDYDENGIPYWDYHWSDDPDTGDAWRLIKNDK